PPFSQQPSLSSSGSQLPSHHLPSLQVAGSFSLSSQVCRDVALARGGAIDSFGVAMPPWGCSGEIHY
ncbi:hypothetical protein A2U01_0010867, partial [Trifolium medium]|nr:hypothetical protein [Trifolium medium]